MVSCGKMCHMPQGSFYSDGEHMFQAKQDCSARERAMLNKKKMDSCSVAAPHRKNMICVWINICVFGCNVVFSLLGCVCFFFTCMCMPL